MPQDYLRDLDDPEKANALIRDAATPSTAQISRAYAASTIYLAYQTKAAGEKLAGSVTSLTSRLQDALANHGEALRDDREVRRDVRTLAELRDMGARLRDPSARCCRGGYDLQGLSMIGQPSPNPKGVSTVELTCRSDAGCGSGDYALSRPRQYRER